MRRCFFSIHPKGMSAFGMEVHVKGALIYFNISILFLSFLEL